MDSDIINTQRSNNSMSFFGGLFKAPNITCKVHKKEFITVDTLKFKVTCSKCKENGDKNKYLEIKYNESKDSDGEDEDIECHVHSNTKGTFYCDDCQVFLCKLCFANEHRTHKSNLPSDIAISYRKDLKEIMGSISQVKPRIDESLKCISEIDKKIKGIRETSINRMKGLVAKINSIIKSKYDNVLVQFESTFEGMDVEVENVYKRLESLQKKSIKNINDINEIFNYLESHQHLSSLELCEYKKNKTAVIHEIQKMLEDSKNFLNFKIENTKNKANSKLKDYNKYTEKFFKQNKIYEKSVLNSINTGISSSSLRLRRFNKFSKKVYEYYKTSSLLCKVNTPICLVGFGLCGLYMNHKESSGSGEQSVNTKGTNQKVPIQIEVAEIKNDDLSKRESLIKEIHHMCLIQNTTDPSFVIYLNKAINLKPEMKYILTVTNLHKDSYLELWCGQVSKFFLKEMKQFIHCNTTGINFEFLPAEGVESDFNEFNSGLIGDLIYSSLG
jgi:hypothetical protein